MPIETKHVSPLSRVGRRTMFVLREMALLALFWMGRGGRRLLRSKVCAPPHLSTRCCPTTGDRIPLNRVYTAVFPPWVLMVSPLLVNSGHTAILPTPPPPPHSHNVFPRTKHRPLLHRPPPYTSAIPHMEYGFDSYADPIPGRRRFHLERKGVRGCGVLST